MYMYTHTRTKACTLMHIYACALHTVMHDKTCDREEGRRYEFRERDRGRARGRERERETKRERERETTKEGESERNM